MKQKLIALLCALALCLSAVGCGSPAAVGKLGSTEITAGMYLMAQYSALVSARNQGTEEQQKLSAADFLKEQLPVDENGELTDAENAAATVLAADYVAAETLKQLQLFAAVEEQFAAMGGELTNDRLAAAEADANSLWASNGETYEANGIGMATLRTYQRNNYKAQALLELIYGENGEKAVTDDQLLDFLNNEMVYGAYVPVPLYNSSTFVFADSEQQAAMTQHAEDAVQSYNTLLQLMQGEAAEDEAAEDVDDEEMTPAVQQLNAMYSVLYTALPEIYAEMDMTYDVSAINSDFYTDLFTRDELATTFGDECGEAIGKLQPGEMTVSNYGGFTMVFFLRMDPLDENELSSLRPRLLSELKGEELSETLQAAGAALENGLNASAMKKLPAAKIR